MDERSAWVDPFKLEPVVSPRETKFRRTGKTLGLISVVAGLPLTFLTCAGSIQSDWNPGLIYISVSWVLRFVVLWFALNFPLAGGILLIVDGSLLAWLSLAYIFGGQVLASLTFLLIPAGILFTLTWFEHRKNNPPLS